MHQKANMVNYKSVDEDDQTQILNHLKQKHDNKSFIRNFALVACRDYLGGIWKMLQTSQITVEPVTGGLTNFLYLCKIKDDLKPIGDEPEQVLLRIYGGSNHNNSSVVLNDVLVSTIMSCQSIGPKIYGVMPTGRLEEFIKSTTLLATDLYASETSANIAVILAKLHSLQIPLAKERNWLFETIAKYMNKVESLKMFEDADKQTKFKRLVNYNFKHEFLSLKCLLQSVESQIVFCHNDLQPGNILRLLDGKLFVIDYEYASYNHRGFDFGNHFCEWAMRNSSDDFPFFSYDMTKYPNKEQQLNFISSYLNEYAAIKKTTTNDDDTEQLLLEANYYALASHFFWSLWAICQAACMDLDFSFLDYAIVRMGFYFEHKKQILDGIVPPNFSSNLNFDLVSTVGTTKI